MTSLSRIIAEDIFYFFRSQKVYLVYRSGGKSLVEASHNKSNTAKFISHKPRATYASASSVNASTGQLHYPGMNGE